MTASRLALLGACVLLGCGVETPGQPVVTPDAATDLPDAPAIPDAPPPPDAQPPPPDAPPPPPDGPRATIDRDIDGLIAINELMAVNAATVTDDQGLASSWIELYNPTSVSVPLDGYALSDDLGAPMKAVFTGGLVLASRGHLVVWLDGSTGGGAHAELRLAEMGGTLALARPDGSFIGRVQYGAQETDFSAAREPDGSDRWAIEWHPSPGAANPGGAGKPKGPDVPSQPPEAIPAAGDLSERILGYDTIPAIGFIVDDAAIAQLAVDPRSYVRARIVFDGRDYATVGLRLKGGGTFETFDHKPSLRISIDQYVGGARFFGLKDLTLNNMHSDFSMMHERLAYLIARTAGVPASRSNHATVTVNGALYGLYANVETVKKQMIKRWFPDGNGSLFEATDVDFEARYLPLYQLESGADDRSLIAALDAALTLSSPDEAMAAAAAVIDLPELLRYMAMCAVIAQLDSFPYSDPGDDFHLYADPGTGRLSFLPWGMDETFYSSQLDVKVVHSVLARTCFASPACLQAWADQTWDILALVESLGLENERQRIIAQIAPYVAADRRKPYSDAQVAEFQMNLYWFLSNRRDDLEKMLPPPSATR